ncbi:MAG: ubiquinone biosynthesis methyltransferase UbiE [Rickettsiales bacterium]|nr:ubiquinone biosynthesis methyltransferase UbiE [Rickettsiales bacterium]|tara:strand:- start:1373 stop:2443 length:1071 start_codon:yes stop_codon:yes gene_type:complete
MIFQPEDHYMPAQLDKYIYQATQKLRSAWYSAHYAAALRLAPAFDYQEDGPLPSWRAIYADLNNLLVRDWSNIRKGLYPAPPLTEMNPISNARKSLAFFRDLSAVNRRRHAGIGQEVFKPGLRGHYPRYFLQNFHYQSGGYLTDESAALYDHQVEVLFVGGADAMRRQCLGSLLQFIQSATVQETKHLDVACGTGRFLAMLKDARPRIRVAGADLSLPYLREARRGLMEWSRTGLIQTNAEALPFADASHETLSCVFLFHELPRQVRRQVAAEMSRVLKPGGRLFFLDSMQIGDRPDYDALLRRFPLAFHEPYYHDFITSDLTELFEQSGLRILRTQREFFAKLIVAEKPEASANA